MIKMTPNEVKLLIFVAALLIVVAIYWYSGSSTPEEEKKEGYTNYASGGITNPKYPTTGTAFDPHSVKLQGITRLEDLEATEDINNDKIYRAYSTMGGIPEKKSTVSKAGKKQEEYLTPTDLLGEDSRVEADNILSAEFNSHVLSTGLIGASAVPRIMKDIDLIRGANIPPKSVITSVVGNAPVSDLSRGYVQTESLMASSYDQ